MVQAWNWLIGKKSYIIAFAAAIYGAGIATNLWPHSQALDIFLGSGAVASLRHSISTTAQQQEAVTIAESSKTP